MSVNVYGGKINDFGVLVRDRNDPGEWVVFGADGKIKEVISGG